jgi:hypothetical protein
MTADEFNKYAENEFAVRTRNDYAIEWKRVPTAFDRCLLVATLAYSYGDADSLTHHSSLVLGKIFAECIEDTLSRFIFWLNADFNIGLSHIDVETREAIRAELTKTVKPLTALQIAQMNAHVNSMPDYLRVFYLEDYFESLAKNVESRSLRTDPDTL